MVKTDINKQEVSEIIKKYVDEKYPLKVQSYKNSLKKQKEQKIKKVDDETFVQNSLMWQDQMENRTLKLNRLEFKVYCRKMELANRKDWRVPTYKELSSLVNYDAINPASSSKIKYINPAKYWSSSSSVFEKKHNWFVDFKDGSSDIQSDLNRLNIRCVREISSAKGRY